MILGMRIDLLNNGLSTARQDQEMLMLSHQFIKGTSIAGNQLRFLTMITMKEDTK